MTTDTTVLQQQTIATTTSDWSQTVTFAPFDPLLGTLVDVQVGITADVTGSVSLENLGATSGTAVVSLPGEISVFDPSGAFIADVNADATGSATLAAFDGTDNYLGNSGTTLAGLSSTQSLLDFYQVTTSDLALFSGTDPVSLTVDASVLFDEAGLANLQALSHAGAGAVISLQYDYIAAGGTNTGGGGSGTTSISQTFFPISTNSLTTSPQTFTIANATTGWADDLLVAKFDPALGALETVNITVTGNEIASVGAANLDATPATVGATETATLTLALPGPTTSVTTSPSVTDSMSLGSFDGTQGFSGASGKLDQGLTGTATTSTQLGSAADLAPFTGSGTISLPLSAVGTSSLDGPGNLLTELLDQAGGTVAISYTYTPVDTSLVQCFAAGTQISTERGEIAVEAIRVGDKVRVVLGDGLAPVIWVGRREADCARHAQPRKVWPVRVAAGAFGPGRPRADLFLSPDHSLYVHEVLIPVRHLINGSTIMQVPVERVTYYRLELSQHDVLLAEGMPAESYLDMRDGSNYANRAGPFRLCADHAARMWEAFGCAPLIVTGPELAAARALVASFAAEQAAA
jgi:hypothetical protein